MLMPTNRWPTGQSGTEGPAEESGSERLRKGSADWPALDERADANLFDLRLLCWHRLSGHLLRRISRSTARTSFRSNWFLYSPLPNTPQRAAECVIQHRVVVEGRQNDEPLRRRQRLVSLKRVIIFSTLVFRVRRTPPRCNGSYDKLSRAGHS